MSAAGAASVAAELLAFYREPVVHRPRYLHGQQPLPPGHVVLRFALARFPHEWARDQRARDREEVRTAALTFVRQVCLWEHATHYQLLCLPADAGRDAIRENYHLLIALIHPDRQEVASQAWPTGASQRANHAYEVLSDARARAGYDAGLARPAEAAFDARVHEAARQGAGHRRSRPAAAPGLAKRVVIVAGVIATLFVVQSWWVVGLKPEYSLLERTMPSSLRWGGALQDVPRFLGTSIVDPGPQLEPLQEPKRLPALASWVPVPAETRPAPAPLALATELPARPATPPGAIVPEAPVREAQAPAREASVTAVPAAPARAVAAPSQPSAEPPLRLAQAGATPKGLVEGPSRDQVEGVVALLVGYYDAGDSERLVALVDADALGWWQGMRTRNAYAEFFAGTKVRRLRMERLTWNSNGAIAEARGEATVTAEYQDGRPRLERRVPVELDIALRAGAPRITRLVLFPNG